MSEKRASATKERRRFTVDALFTDNRPQAVGVDDLPTAKEIRIERIVPDPNQPRQTFDEARLQELTESIRLEGVLQPIVVRYDEAQDRYVIVHGERRWRASQQAGLKSIPALVRDVPDDRRLVHQLMENIVREDLNAVDRAAALRVLKSQLGDAPWDQVAEKVGIRRSRLFQLLGTEKLPSTVQDDIRAGRLSEKQSRALQGLPPGQQTALRDAIIADSLSAEQAMRLARSLRSSQVPDDPAAAALKLAELTSSDRLRREQRQSLPDDPFALLAAIAGAAAGGSRERAMLTQAAESASAAPFDAERLQEQVHALARTLSRAPATSYRADGQSYQLLKALSVSLDALLGPE
jgi:ParB family transcriptional regulator, chromosome partitioning protein